MPIQSGDVKLLKSAVMADVPEGGGAPTGNVIVDGVSNSIFPDISEFDRAGGAVHVRKVFASVQTPTVDTFMGSNAILSAPTQDDGVSMSLFNASSFFEERSAFLTRLNTAAAAYPRATRQLAAQAALGATTVILDAVDSPLAPIVGGGSGGTSSYTYSTWAPVLIEESTNFSAFSFAVAYNGTDQQVITLPDFSAVPNFNAFSTPVVDVYYGAATGWDATAAHYSQTFNSTTREITLTFNVAFNDGKTPEPGSYINVRYGISTYTNSGPVEMRTSMTKIIDDAANKRIEVQGRLGDYYTGPLFSGAVALGSTTFVADQGVTGSVQAGGLFIMQSATGFVDYTYTTYRTATVTTVYDSVPGSITGVDLSSAPAKPVVFRANEYVVLSHKGSINATVSNAQVIDCARVRLSRVRVIGADGVVINTGYTTDLEAGTVTFTSVTGYSQPVTVEHYIEDMALISGVNATTKTLTLARALSHTYPVGSQVCGAVVFGNLFARVSALFDLSTWDGTTWSDATGSPAAATFNDAGYPVAVTNAGAISERWIAHFTNTTTFNIYGETAGFIAVGSTGAACTPINPITGEPYFTIPAEGWGSGWSTGNALRFNTVGSISPMWLVRTVQPSTPEVENDSFTLLIRGDVDTQ